jgi:hypothetical protein
MKLRQVYWLGFVVFLANLGLAVEQHDRRNVPNVDIPNVISVGYALSQRGALRVLVPKANQHRPGHDYPWEILLNAFQSDFPDFNLDLQILEGNDFTERLLSSPQDPHFPDAAFVDDYDLRPLQDLAVVMMCGRARFEFADTWVIFRHARNFEAAKDFLLWLAQSPRWKPMQVSTTSIGPEDIAKVQAISKKAVLAFAYGSSRSLWSVMDPAGGHFDDFGACWPHTLKALQPLLTFGNSRLAFVLLAEVGQTDSPGLPSFGMAHSAVILRNQGDGWKVLSILPDGSLPDLEGLLRAFDQLGLDEGPPEAVSKVRLLAPLDHVQLGPHSFPYLEWTQVVPNPAGYVIETQFTPLGVEYWSPSALKIISSVPDESSVRTRMPYGNPPPQRWRIWAISKSGIVTTSDWRVIDFTN